MRTTPRASVLGIAANDAIVHRTTVSLTTAADPDLSDRITAQGARVLCNSLGTPGEQSRADGRGVGPGSNEPRHRVQRVFGFRFGRPSTVSSRVWRDPIDRRWHERMASAWGKRTGGRQYTEMLDVGERRTERWRIRRWLGHGGNGYRDTAINVGTCVFVVTGG